MSAVFEHEIKSYFHSVTACIFCAFLLLFVGVGAMLYNIQASVANFEYVLQFVCLGLVVIVPVLTMKTVAEEKKQHTDRLLYSLPLKTADIVLGKYFAVLAVFAVPLCIIAFYPLIFSRFGDVYLATSYGSLFAFFLMGGAMLAIGMFASSLTENQGFAAGIAIPFFLFNYYSVTLADYVASTAFSSLVAICVMILLLGLIILRLTRNDNIAFAFSAVLIAASGVTFFINTDLFEGLMPAVMRKLSLFDRFYTFVNGVFDLGSIVYFLSVTVFFLLLTAESLEKRRYN